MGWIVGPYAGMEERGQPKDFRNRYISIEVNRFYL